MVQTIPNNVSTKQYMQPNEFCFWLQGLFELCPDLKCLTEAQVKMIRDHLNYVFEGKPSVAPAPYATSTPFVQTTYPGIGGGSTISGAILPDSPILTTVC